MRHAKLTSTSESESSNLITLSANLTAHSSVLQALIDSGATLNFINEWIVTQLNLKTEPCPSTRVTLADGRLLTHSARQVTLEYTVAGVSQLDTFLVAPIGDHSLILGMPWLERVNPRIDWRIKSVDADNFPSSPSSSPPPGLDSQPSSEVPAPMKFPLRDEKHPHSHINPNLASKESKESTESNVYSFPPIKSSNSPSSASSSKASPNPSRSRSNSSRSRSNSSHSQLKSDQPFIGLTT